MEALRALRPAHADDETVLLMRPHCRILSSEDLRHGFPYRSPEAISPRRLLQPQCPVYQHDQRGDQRL